MSLEERNRLTAQAWAETIVRYGLRARGYRQVRLPAGVPPFRFFALSPVVPLNDKAWNAVVSDQRRLAAHAIISALPLVGRHGYLAGPEEEPGYGFAAVSLPEVNVEVEYKNYDGCDDEDQAYDVHFGLRLHVSREPIGRLQLAGMTEVSC